MRSRFLLRNAGLAWLFMLCAALAGYLIEAGWIRLRLLLILRDLRSRLRQVQDQ